MSIIDRLNAILGSEEHGAVKTENTPDINKAVNNVGTPQTEDKPIAESVTNNVVKPAPIPAEAERATPNNAEEVVAGTESEPAIEVVTGVESDPAVEVVTGVESEPVVEVVPEITPEVVPDPAPPVVEVVPEVVVDTTPAVVADGTPPAAVVDVPIASEVVAVESVEPAIVPEIIDPPVDVPVAVEVTESTPDSPVMIHPTDHATAVAAIAASKDAAILEAQSEAESSLIEAQYYAAGESLSEIEVISANQEAGLEQLQSDIEKLEERYEDMHANLSGLESMFSGDRPWNPELANIYYNNCSKISSRTFGDEDITAVRGMENFADVDTAKLDILAGTEAMEKRAGKMLEGVKQFFIKLYNTVIDFIDNLFSGFTAAQVKADALLGALSKASDERIKETINLGGWNSYVNVEDGDGIRHLETMRKGLAKLGDALKNQNANSIIETIGQGFKGIADGLSKQSVVEDKHKYFRTYIVDAGGIRFTISAPSDNVEGFVGYKQFKSTAITYTKNTEVKTSGEYKTGYGKAKLIELARATKAEAQKAKDSKFSASALKTARDKAIGALESSIDKRNDDYVLKQGNTMALNASRTLFKYQLECISAQQAMIFAHIKKT